MNLKKLILIGVVAALATVSFAQGRGFGMFGRGGGSSAMLLRRTDVQADLQLTDEQKTKLQALQDTMRQSMQEVFQNAGDDPDARQKAMADFMKKTTDEVNKILTEDQQKRLKEINLQIQGNTALVGNKDLEDQIGLSQDQKDKIDALSKKQQEAMQAIGEKLRNQELSFQDARPLFEKNQQTMKDEIDKILTEDQKGKLKAAGGKPFVSTEQPRGPGGGR